MHPYLARDCTGNASNSDTEGDTNTNEIGGRDAEKQNVHIMQLSDVKKAVMEGKFVEVQWSNTVSLAMLHYLSLNE